MALSGTPPMVAHQPTCSPYSAICNLQQVDRCTDCEWTMANEGACVPVTIGLICASCRMYVEVRYTLVTSAAITTAPLSSTTDAFVPTAHFQGSV